MNFETRLQSVLQNEKILPSTFQNLLTWLQEESLPDWARESLLWLIKKEQWTELNNRFFESLSFGTAGLRGRTISELGTPAELGAWNRENPEPKSSPLHAAVGSACMNDFNVIRATIGLYRYCENWLLNHSDTYDLPKVVIAYDMRYFSKHFGMLAAHTWETLGGHALLFDGPRSTPELSFAVRHLHATAGIVITASHNPYYDNGFKAYFFDGAQVVEPHVSGITERVQQVKMSEVCSLIHTTSEKHRYKILPYGFDEVYLERLKSSVIDPILFENYSPKIVYTPLHGTGSVISEPLMKAFRVDFHTLPQQEVMDSRFRTVKSPNPENAEALNFAIEHAKKESISYVLASDPDADRTAMAYRKNDGNFEILTGNQVAVLLAYYRLNAMKSNRWIATKGTQHATIIASCVTTPLLKEIAHRNGIKFIETLIGFKWIGEKLEHYEQELYNYLLSEKGLAVNYRALREDIRRKLLLKFSTYLVLGCEESCGYMALDITRDKDANSTILMLCELLCYLEKTQQSLQDYLEGIWNEYGFYDEKTISSTYTGAEGQNKIKQFMSSLQNRPITQLGGLEVTETRNRLTTEYYDEDGKLLPKANIYELQLERDYRVIIRPSGTEPKIKFYLFAREDGKNLKKAKLESQKIFALIEQDLQNEQKLRTEKR